MRGRREVIVGIMDSKFYILFFPLITHLLNLMLKPNEKIKYHWLPQNVMLFIHKFFMFIFKLINIAYHVFLVIFLIQIVYNLYLNILWSHAMMVVKSKTHHSTVGMNTYFIYCRTWTYSTCSMNTIHGLKIHE